MQTTLDSEDSFKAGGDPEPELILELRSQGRILMISQSQGGQLDWRL